MRQIIFCLMLSFLILNGTRLPVAEATCGSADCFLITGNHEGMAAKDQFVFDLSYRFVTQRAGLNGSDRISGSPLVAAVEIEKQAIVLDEHRESATTNQSIQMDLAYGITDRFTLGMTLPWVSRQHDHTIGLGESLAGEKERWVASSLGDLRLKANFSIFTTDRFLLTLGGGAEFPTGEFNIRNNEGKIQEPTLQPGRGAYGLLASIYHAYQWVPGRFSHFASASYRNSFENRLNYTFGDEFILGAGMKVRVRRKLSFIGQLNARYTDRDQFVGKLEQAINGGEVDLDETIAKRELSNTGSIIVTFSPGISIDVSAGIKLYSYIQIPVVRRLNEQNLAPGTGLLTGMSYTF